MPRTRREERLASVTGYKWMVEIGLPLATPLGCALLLFMTPVSQDEVLLDWYRSEAARPDQQRHRVPFEAQNRGLIEQELANSGIRYLRGMLFRKKSTGNGIFFDDYPLAWFKTAVSVRSLASATAIDCWGMPHCRTVGDVARLVPELAQLRIAASQINHRPVLVAADAKAQPVLMDGYHRAAGLINSAEAASIPIFFGVGAGVTDWFFHR